MQWRAPGFPIWPVTTRGDDPGLGIARLCCFLLLSVAMTLCGVGGGALAADPGLGLEEGFPATSGSAATVSHGVESSLAGAPVIQLLVFERPPYYVRMTAGGFGGVVADPAANALTRAGVPFTWRLMEPNGHLRTVAANDDPVCAVGWFRKPDREALGLFTDPLYQDQPQVVLTRADNVAVQAHHALRDLMAAPGLRLGAKLGYAYGPYVDALIAEARPQRSTASQTDTGLVRMLLGGRFDYMIVAFEEVNALIGSFGDAGQDLLALTLTDMPPGNTRHLLCSRQVGETVVDRINAALSEGAAEAQ